MAKRGGTLRTCGSILAAAWLFAQPAAAAVPEDGSDLSGYRRTAQQLYQATSADAVTFTRAITDDKLRREVELVFKRHLSPDALREMARQARAEASYWQSYLEGLTQLESRRAIPGRPLPAETAPPPVVNPGAVLPPQPVETSGYIPLPDRWRILDALGRPDHPFDPYNTNTLKGDKPVFGKDWFIELGAISDTLFQASRVPLPVSGIASARPESNNTFGRYGQILFSQTELLSFSLIKGDTAYKPPDFEFRLTPGFNFNHTQVGELGIININPQQGTVRNDGFVGLQEGFIDYHIRNVSEYYDFDSVRFGIQPFSTDFRGFLFQDNEPGVRFFGDRDANRWQYNLAYFRRLEKDTNSGLNDIGQPFRRDGIFIANLYRQDFPVLGFTSQAIFARNDNEEGHELYYDKNGFLVRPAQIGDNRGYNYDVNYLGLNGDGHFGRLNLTGSAYWAFGHQTHNQFGPPQNHGTSINAFFAAAEPSMDFNYFRLRLSGLYASGDGDPRNGHATGFDAIFENPQFAGADTSYWIRQSLPFIGGGVVGLNTQNGVLADLRASKGQGQSNFVNPGIELVGIGGDLDILPELRLSTNFDYLRFDKTASLKFLRHQANVPNGIGYDLSAALIYRPLNTQNIVFSLSAAALFPGGGLKAIYNTAGGSTPFGSGNFLYTLLFDMILTY
ncbi:MAG TPA: hypothetical protein VJ770_16295 [Stellaceae bacterium]|nr:hypothetical protein [Stellaceae bacterium]